MAENQSPPNGEPAPPPLVRMRSCPACRIKKPVTEFDKSTGLNVCSTCLPQTQWSISLHRKREEAERAFRQILDANGIARSRKAPKTEDMLCQLMEEFGGTNGFVKELADQMKELMVNKPGHPETVRSFQAVLKLVHENNKRQDVADRDPLTLEQIQQAKQVALFDMVTEMIFDREKATVLLEMLEPIRAAEQKLLEDKTIDAAAPQQDPSPEVADGS